MPFITTLLQTFAAPFRSLKNHTFAKLYFAQTISLLGDALSWVGLALLVYEISPENATTILANALTMRVIAFIVFSQFTGLLSQKVSRKKILLVTHFMRMLIICLLPFVNAQWQIYALIFGLNVFNAFFTPTYRSIIPQVTTHKDFRQAVGLSTATYQLLGVIGPAIAGVVAFWIGARQIFFLDGLSFVLAGLIIISIPSLELQKGAMLDFPNSKTKVKFDWRELMSGTVMLFKNPILRFALAIEFVSAIAGAMILVDTIGHVKNTLLLDDKYYGLVMAAFGIGAGISAFVLGHYDKTKTRSVSLIAGALVLGLSIAFANFVPFYGLFGLWLLAGLGQSLAEMPSETLIAENIDDQNHVKAYGSHFAVSHFWWAIAYPIAGLLGARFPRFEFLIGGVLTLVILGIALLFLKPKIDLKTV